MKTKPLFKKYGILSVYNLYPYYNLLELYKILNSVLLTVCMSSLIYFPIKLAEI